MSREILKLDSLDMAILRGTTSLLLTLNELYEKEIEPLRLALAVKSLLSCGIQYHTPIVAQSVERLAGLQRPDGGWTGIVDTCHCIYVFGFLDQQDIVEKAGRWLQAQRQPGGGWGRFPRDISRIPTTSLVINTLIDHGFSPTAGLIAEAATFLIATWQKEFGPGGLTYKASHVLSTFSRLPPSTAPELANRTLMWLLQQQEPDGGYAPWRGHPGGPTRQITAVVLDGLLDWGTDLPAPGLAAMVAYLLAGQEKSGRWPEHEIDAVSSRALLAIYRYALNC